MLYTQKFLYGWEMWEMDIIVFLKKFIIYLTILYVLWIPIVAKYISYSVVSLDLTSFISFYLPLNMIPFVALVFATPIERSRMVKIIISGLLLTIILIVSIYRLQMIFLTFQTELFHIYAIGRIAFPFLLWIAFTYKIVFASKD